MNKAFNIQKGIYIVPNIGRVDCNNPVDNKTAVALYRSRKFPFIELKEKGVELLRKEKLSPKEVSTLILDAKTTEEVDFLLQVCKEEALQGIAETRKKTLSAEIGRASCRERV